MLVLVVDSSTPAVTAALAEVTAEAVVLRAERCAVDARAHGELLAPHAQAVLAEAGVRPADLGAIVAGLGPGPFTGLRVGLVTARMLGLALGVPVRGICSLDVVASQAVAAGVGEPFVVVSDARRKELFHATYDAQGRRTDGPHVSRPEDVPAGALLVVGPGVPLYPDTFDRTAGPDTVDAAALGALLVSGHAEITEPEPLYLRRPDAVVPGPPKRAS